MLNGLTTVRFYAPDMEAAKRWYTELLGLPPYFDTPDYMEFRIGDYQHELGFVHSSHAGTELSMTPAPDTTGPAGSLVYWHVDDVPAALDRLVAMGAKEHDPPIDRGQGFITASVADPWGNLLGLMYNPHYLSILAAMKESS
ncbi:VOC family protein [Nonomuraea basaltis]|uniref:VOC family protein n=1 Tax=Nonomuraea basaltis TaxID=2495887 RepID=UPI00110C536A|nr:VOC family protein [Nonomuraea basaltis]TMR91148.1 VOC family protein [Nonomuraea basaltis]